MQIGRSVGFIALALLAASTAAQNYSWLDKALVAKLTTEDVEVYERELVNTLMTHPDGVAVTWKSWRSGHWGVITPREQVTRNGLRCRRANVAFHIDDRSAEGHYTFCLLENGDWRFMMDQ